jgi:hypothetical protein
VDALTDERDIEVDEKGKAVTCEFEIGQYLCTMNGLDRLDGLEFHYEAPLNQQIQPQPRLQLDTVIQDRHDYLALDAQSALR